LMLRHLRSVGALRVDFVLLFVLLRRYAIP